MSRPVLRAAFLALPALLAGAALANPVASVSSPGGTLKVSISLNPEGRPGYAIERHGTPVIEESRLGFLLTDAPKLERNFTLDGTAERTVDETWEQPWGERRFVRNHFKELRVRLKENKPPARTLEIVFRVYEAGVGFR